MSDRIEVRGLRVLATHGALPHEQEAPQPFELDLDVEADLDPAARSDQLAQAVDYGRLVEAARRVVAEGHFQLLEALAAAVAEALLAEQGVRGVTVRVRKLRPPLPADLSSAGVRLSRRREEAPHHDG